MIYCPLTTLLSVNGYLQYIHQSSRLKRLQKKTACSASFIFCLQIESDNSGHLSTKIYDKREMIYFPYPCSNILSSPAYGVYIAQYYR